MNGHPIYPTDFTFIHPAKITAINASFDIIQDKLGCEVFAIYTDTKFSHKQFAKTETLLKNLKLTIRSDPTREIARKFSVLIEDKGIALRGLFLVNPDGIVIDQEVTDSTYWKKRKRVYPSN